MIKGFSMNNAAFTGSRICLDQAATSFPKPPCVAQAVLDYMTNIGSNVSRSSYASAYEAEDTVLETRELLCSLFGWDDPAGVIFTPNITASLNWILKGLLNPGDHVLVTSMEHNAVMRPLTQLTEKGVTFDRIPCDRNGLPDLSALPALVKEQTKMLVCLHASNVNGAVMPLEKLGRFCRDHSLLFVVDTAQSAGRCPVDMKALHIDCLAFTSHKGLLGPQGIGGFILSKDLALQMDPLISGGTGSFSHTELIPKVLPDRLEAGTLNLPGIYGLSAALKWIRETGIQTIYEHEYALFRMLREGFESIEGVRIIGCPAQDEPKPMPVLSIQTPGRDIALVSALLDERSGIQTRVGLHCAPAAHRTLGTFPEGTIRFSPGFFNTEEEIRACIQALEQVLEQVPVQN